MKWISVAELCLILNLGLLVLSAEVRGRSDLSGCGINKETRKTVHLRGERIPIGRDAYHGEIPWQVSLQRWDYWSGLPVHTCGGTVLDRNYVITAAHCVSGRSPENLQVLVGAHNLRNPNEQRRRSHNVSVITVHEKFDREKVWNDIAILKLSTPLDIDGSEGYVNGACLPEPMTEPAGKVQVSGWEDHRHAYLQVDSLPVVPATTCRYAYGEELITDSVFCAGRPSGVQALCQGHSGGPAAQKISGRWYLVGVVSWQYGCGRPGYPEVYTKVSHFVDWIRNRTVHDEGNHAGLK